MAWCSGATWDNSWQLGVECGATEMCADYGPGVMERGQLHGKWVSYNRMTGRGRRSLCWWSRAGLLGANRPGDFEGHELAVTC